MSLDLIFQIVAGLLAVIAATLALKRIDLPTIPHDGPSISDTPQLHILNNQVGMYCLAQPNRRTAYFAVASAGVSMTLPLRSIANWLFAVFYIGL
jgi:hypothetical protein